MLAFQGIPDDKGLRAIYWKIMLGYLPLESRSWKSKLAKMRDNYFQLVAEFLPEQLPEDNQEISEDCGDTEIRNGIKWHSVTPQEDVGFPIYQR